jgi:hypothetical protein
MYFKSQPRIREIKIFGEKSCEIVKLLLIIFLNSIEEFLSLAVI